MAASTRGGSQCWIRGRVKRSQAVTDETTDHSSPDRSSGSERSAGDGQELLRTAAVLRATGITHQVLYRYVTLGLIEAAESTPRGQRLFHPDVVTLIEVIKSLNRSGYSLRDMKEIFFKDQRVRRALGVKPTRAKS